MKKFAAGAINRAEKETIYPGGKGINVALVLGNLHIPARMLGFMAGFTGQEIERLCEKTEAIVILSVWTAGIPASI